MVVSANLGARNDGTFGLDVARPGFDAIANDPLLNPERFAFSSKWDRLEKILQAGSIRSGSSFNVNIDVTAFGFFPIITFCILPVGSNDLTDEGWYKFDWAANPGYSSRLRVYGYKNTSLNTYLYGFIPYDDYYTSRVSIAGDWGISYILWDLKAGEFD